MASKLTEVMVRPFFETRDFSLSLMAENDILNFTEKCDAVAMGPGMSQNKETQSLIRNIVTRCRKPIVMDADGINAMVGYPDILKNRKCPLILTPHPGEMARLTGKDAADVQNDRKNIALKFANEYNTVLVLKGHNTLVADPAGEFYVNETGNAGMATGGTGDVLAGMVASFVGQGLEPVKASALAVYFHGLAGDMAVKEKGPLSLIATDLLHKLPEVLKVLG
jgi:NAD(P)H-hydrate epimerase